MEKKYPWKKGPDLVRASIDITNLGVGEHMVPVKVDLFVTPAQILEHILKKKWTLTDNDRDMVVMWHKFEFFEKEQLKIINSYLISTGEDKDRTGMAKTVGLPLGIAAKLILENKIRSKGITIPIEREIYAPILKELKSCGIEVTEESPREVKMPDSNL